MHSSDEALSLLGDLLAASKRAGADAVDAVLSAAEEVSVGVRLGATEDISRAESAEAGLRAIVGDRSAIVSLSDFTPAAIDEAAARAVAMARAASADPYAGLADAGRLAGGPLPDLDLDDGGPGDLEALERRALACEDAARAVAGVTNSGGGGASATRALYAFAASNGFAGARVGTSYSLYASVIAGVGDAMQRDYAQHGARHEAELEAAEHVGRRAGERTVARLNPARARTGAMPVIFDRRVSNSLLGHLAAAISGAAIARGTSFLDDPEARLFAPGVRVTDDPRRPRGLKSRAFDGEGLPACARDIVSEGRLTGWLMDVAAARQLGLEPTGHAVRGTNGGPGIGTTNLDMQAGRTSLADLIGDTRRGVLVTELIGHGINMVTGDYSRGASGFLIEQGEVTRPVDGLTIAGNLRHMFANLTPADDFERRHATNAPSVLVTGMTVAGG